jgi:hypothetical protein
MNQPQNMRGICSLYLCVQYGPICRLHKYRVLQYSINSFCVYFTIKIKNMEDITVLFLRNELSLQYTYVSAFALKILFL